MLENDIDSMMDSHLFRGFSRDDCNVIYETVKPVEKYYSKKETIILQGQNINNVGILKSGRIIATKYHYDGSAQLLKIIARGGIVNLDAVSSTFVTSPYEMTAQTDAGILFFKYNEFYSNEYIPLFLKEKLYKNVITILADENVKIMYKVDILSKRTLRERIISYLSIISEKRSKSMIKIGMNQEEFSQYLCVNRSVLSKELNVMRREGIIEYRKDQYHVNWQICHDTSANK